MTNLAHLTSGQLHEILVIKEHIEMLQRQLDSVAGGDEIPIPSSPEAPRSGRRSAAVRARMSAAAKARWAKIKGADAADSKPAKKKRRISAAHRRKLMKSLAKAQKMRWAEAKGTKMKVAKRNDRRSSPAVRAKLAAAARARWAKARVEGKTTL
jgi:hypothetical protein